MARLIDANALSKKWQDMLDIKTGEKEEFAGGRPGTFENEMGYDSCVSSLYPFGCEWCKVF